jgi:hypothetical protein
LFSYFKKKNQLLILENKHTFLQNEIKHFELKNSLLSDNIDLDYIEILIRQKFLFGKKKEIIYIIDK